MTPTELLAAAERLLDRPDAKTAGIWPRAAALLVRQALEQALARFWQCKGLRLDQLATRPQLICVETYLPEGHLGAKASHLWWSLTQACHHHPYDLTASHTELRGWLTAVQEAVTAMASVQPAE